jgi:hypothetical protein
MTEFCQMTEFLTGLSIPSFGQIPSFRLPPRVRFFVRDGMIPERRGGRLGAARAGDFAVSWGRGKT